MQPGNQLPADTTVVKQFGPWSIYVSRSSFSMYIETGDYHALPLELSFNDLRELVRIMEEVGEQTKRDAKSLLHDSMKQMIADVPAKKILDGSRIELLPPEK